MQKFRMRIYLLPVKTFVAKAGLAQLAGAFAVPIAIGKKVARSPAGVNKKMGN